jgi:hypothetical protein
MNHRFTVDLTAAARQPLKAGWISEGIAMCSPLSDADLEADAVRLLEQASLGPTEASVAEVKSERRGGVDRPAAQAQRHALHAASRTGSRPTTGARASTT